MRSKSSDQVSDSGVVPAEWYRRGGSGGVGPLRNKQHSGLGKSRSTLLSSLAFTHSHLDLPTADCFLNPPGQKSFPSLGLGGVVYNYGWY